MFDANTYLNDVLAVTSQTWCDEFREVHGLNAEGPPEGMTLEDWRQYKAYDQMAKWIVDGSRNLHDANLHMGPVLEAFRKIEAPLEDDPFFKQALEVHFAGELEDELSHFVDRAIELAGCLIGVPYERARAYLSRVGSCYIRGLRTETVVMCGAVLDAALQEHVSDEQVRAAQKCGRFVSLGNRVEYLRIAGHISAEMAATAFELVHERNKAIHTVPEATASAYETIQTLAQVLNALFPDPTGSDDGHNG